MSEFKKEEPLVLQLMLKGPNNYSALLSIHQSGEQHELRYSKTNLETTHIEETINLGSIRNINAIGDSFFEFKRRDDLNRGNDLIESIAANTDLYNKSEE
jgi:hypothetical protein